MSDSLAICVCTHNGAERLADTLDTIAALEDPARRITSVVIIDNNSSDRTAEVARTHTLAPRVVHEARLGVAHARRRGIAETDEPLFAFVDDDVLLDPRWATELLEAADKHPSAGSIGGRINLLWETGPTPLARRCSTKLASQSRGDAPRDIERPEDPLITAAILYRRAALQASGWIEQGWLVSKKGRSLTSGEDLEIGVRIRNAGYTIRYEPAARAQHRIPAARQTREYLARLSRGIGQGEPFIRWLDAGAPTDAEGRAWLAPKLDRAERKHKRTRFLEWRPDRRAIRLAERTGRLEGYRLLAQMIDAGGDHRPDAGEALVSEAPPA